MTNSSTKIASALSAKQVQTWLSFGYLMMVGLGMLYYSQKYNEFGINIFQYATILYFLIAPFEDLVILKLSTIAAFVLAIGYRADPFIEQRFPRFYSFLYMGMNKSSWFEQYKTWSWLISFLALILVYSVIYADNAYERVLESDDITINYENGTSANGKLIGKTDNVIFLLEQDQVKAIPLESMANMILGRLSESSLQDSAEPPPATSAKDTLTSSVPAAADNTETLSTEKPLAPNN